jgi:hypothetical protein
MATAGQASAQAIKAAEVCVNGVVSKERLALAALTAAGVSRYPERWITANPDGDTRDPAIRLLLASDDFCSAVGGGTDATQGIGLPKCAEADPAKIIGAVTYVKGVLDDRNYGRQADWTAEGFLGDPSAVLTCPGADARPVETAIKQPYDLSSVPLRVRGSTLGLQFRRGTDQFEAVDKATIAFKDDDKAGKETFKVNVIVGLAVPVAKRLEMVPYIGFNVDSSVKDGADREYTDNTLRAGALFAYRVENSGGTHYLLARPEYAANRVDRSEVLSANLAWVPITRWTNDYGVRIRSAGRPVLSVMPVVELRSTAGTFLKQGTRTADNSRDFVRVGGAFGLNVVSDLTWLPLQLTLTETYLYGFAGNPDDLSQLRGVLSVNLDKQKYFGLELGYARGRAEDLLPREHAWTLGFGAKF